MTDDELIEKLAKRHYDERRKVMPGTLTWETDMQWKREESRVIARMLLPVVREAQAEAWDQAIDAVAELNDLSGWAEKPINAYRQAGDRA